MFHGYSNKSDTLSMDGYAPLDDTMLSDDIQVPLLTLPPLARQFFVPPLTDKPQNPIIDTLNRAHEHSLLFKLPQELESLVLNPPLNSRPRKSSHEFWTDALTRNLGIRNKALSWDRLRPSHPSQASSTGFLSEQDDLVFAAARYHVNLRLRDPAVDMMYVTESNILNALKMTVLGTSSVYHTWDSATERFVQAGVEDRKTGYILIDGKDEVVSQSMISRFLTIGTLLRRLETLLVRARSAQDGPTVHAYAHALATIIAHLRQSLVKCPPVNDPLSSENALTGVWRHYEIYEETFIALAELYGRDEQKAPEEYPTFDPSPVTLLSSIYNHLERHIERQSPRTIVAIFAFILTHVSHDYLQQISRSVGYGTDSLKKVSRGTGKAFNKDSFEDEDEGHEEDIFDVLERVGGSFPEFFPRRLLDILPAAQKSLILLERAQPHHPMLQRTTTQGTIQWFWTESLIEAAWKGHYPGGRSETVNNSNCHLPSAEDLDDNQELAIFRIFDLEPGAHPATSTALAKAQTMAQSLQSFINVFPASLPSITPTLSHLTSLVLAPLLDHASTLSTALLALFLTPSSDAQDTLNFEAHLILLRSYLLLTSPPFKARLAAVLFSDQVAGEVDNKAHGLAIRSLRRKPSSKKTTCDENSSEQQRPCAVGLAPSLLERETWPPVGADLSFFLRTVIVDSVDDGWSGRSGECGGGQKVRSRVIEEAEYRLGFAIRDLPTGPGRDKWHDPLSIEALDFLYMDYKPPTALEVLITPDILSKYQRVFAFILRLMRVQHAVASLFRMTRPTAQLLFPTLTPSRKALLHFRFVAQSFVSNLSAYVFDTAISGNFDPLLIRLSIHGEDESSSGADANFSDVFALAKSHSALLDDILTMCLLRSGQRAVGEVLRSALELILEFTIVVGQLYCGRVAEYEAATLLEDISKKFFSRMATLTKVLRGLADKNGLSERTMLLRGSLPGVEMLRKPMGGADALYHLLIRLDLGEYWMTSRR